VYEDTQKEKGTADFPVPLQDLWSTLFNTAQESLTTFVVSPRYDFPGTMESPPYGFSTMYFNHDSTVNHNRLSDYPEPVTHPPDSL
jgi:hypothetical protein